MNQKRNFSQNEIVCLEIRFGSSVMFTELSTRVHILIQSKTAFFNTTAVFKAENSNDFIVLLPQKLVNDKTCEFYVRH